MCFKAQKYTHMYSLIHIQILCYALDRHTYTFLLLSPAKTHAQTNLLSLICHLHIEAGMHTHEHNDGGRVHGRTQLYRCTYMDMFNSDMCPYTDYCPHTVSASYFFLLFCSWLLAEPKAPKWGSPKCRPRNKCWRRK